MKSLRPACALWLMLFAGLASANGTNDEAFWHGRAADGTPSVILHYFYSPTCPHCQQAAPFIAAMDEELDWLELRKYSIKDNRENARLYFLAITDELTRLYSQRYFNESIDTPTHNWSGRTTINRAVVKNQHELAKSRSRS